MNFSIPVLPIPNVVFFPHTSIPVLVVEAVHIRMVKESIANNSNIAISLAEPAGTYLNRVKYNPRNICSMGKPILLEKLPDGSLKILLRGVSRIRLLGVQQNLPYLIYRAEKIYDHSIQHSFSCENKIERLTDILEAWIVSTIKEPTERKTFMGNIESVYHIVDYVSMLLIKDSELKQLLLENSSISERIEILCSIFKGEAKNPFLEDALALSAIKDFTFIKKDLHAVH